MANFEEAVKFSTNAAEANRFNSATNLPNSIHQFSADGHGSAVISVQDLMEAQPAMRQDYYHL